MRLYYAKDEDDDDSDDEESINAKDWEKGYDMTEKEYEKLRESLNKDNRRR